MKLLLCSDLHCDKGKCKSLVNQSTNADIVIVAGDIGNYRKGLEFSISFLRDIKKPTVLVPGNCESYEELKEACENWPNAVVLHGNGITLKRYNFYGVGGGIPITPFGSWSYDFSEKDARKLLVGCPNNGILITHSPPSGALDESSGKSLGSIAIREVVLLKKPLLVVCGHIHESSGKHIVLGKSAIINAGPAGLFWELPDN